jgi:hypothetical protein
MNELADRVPNLPPANTALYDAAIATGSAALLIAKLLDENGPTASIEREMTDFMLRSLHLMQLFQIKTGKCALN